MIDEVPATRVPGWPRRVVGRGAPCQPEAFGPSGRTLAWAEGLTAFPKHLAVGLDVRLGVRVAGLSVDGGLARVVTDDGRSLAAPVVVLALPVEQSAPLLPEDVAPLAVSRRLLGWFSSIPCLSLIAGYPLEMEPLGFDLLLPDDQRAIALISHDSSKRLAPRHRVLVIQAGRRWSAVRLEQPADEWGRALLAEAAALIGPWAATPLWTSAHRWRYARIDSGIGLGGPVLHALPGGARVGLAGEVFGPRGGVEGAWLAGDALADQILGTR